MKIPETSLDVISDEHIPTPQNVIAFLKEIDELSKKHNISIAHEDFHGAFILEKYTEYNLNWLSLAHINLPTGQLPGDSKSLEEK